MTTPQTAIQAVSLDAWIPVSVCDITYLPVNLLRNATQALGDADGWRTAAFTTAAVHRKFLNSSTIPSDYLLGTTSR